MPVWRDATRQWVKDGRLIVLGMVQEQHAERARLYAQWQRLDWPILHDPINLIENRAVPIFVAIDEHGVVRSTRPKLDTLAAEFLDVDFPPPAETDDSPASAPASATPPDLSALLAAAKSQNTVPAWQRYADAQALWGSAAQREQAIVAYEKAIENSPDGRSVDGDRHFRLGVAYRMRYDSEFRRPGDFQAAADHWGRALAIDPNQYIWRRRIEQYGPRLNKPYPFYDWVETAQREITARGETPVELRVPLTESEIARPGRSLEAAGTQADGAAAAEPKSPDPDGRINRDSQELVHVEVAVVPAKIKPGGTARVHITFRPNIERQAHWNNEGGPLRLWLDLPDGYRSAGQLVSAPQGTGPVSTEPRRLELEIQTPTDARGDVRLSAYALYYVCEDADGTCFYLRQEVPITLRVEE